MVEIGLKNNIPRPKVYVIGRNDEKNDFKNFVLSIRVIIKINRVYEEYD